MAANLFSAPFIASTSSDSLSWIARVRVLRVLDQEQHQGNPTIVVPVLITSCQVSLKLKRGPVTTQTITATSNT